MAQKPEDEELKRINLQNLKKQEDKSIREILGNASHTTLYRFDNGSCEWDRVGVEGTTFIVMADIAPMARLIVLNKLDVQNYTLDLAQVNKVKLQPPYLMLRLDANSKHKIMGVWFHDDDERARIKEAMERAIALIPASERGAKAVASTPEPVVNTSTTTQATTKKEDFSMEAMSQNTTVFHDQTHKDGAPLELDKSLPNNFAKVKKEAQSGPPAVTVSVPGASAGTESAGKSKGMALLKSLKSNASSGDLPTDYAITTVAQASSKTKTREEPPRQAPEPAVLYAPSDITGAAMKFPKMRQ